MEADAGACRPSSLRPIALTTPHLPALHAGYSKGENSPSHP